MIQTNTENFVKIRKKIIDYHLIQRITINFIRYHNALWLNKEGSY